MSEEIQTEVAVDTQEVQAQQPSYTETEQQAMEMGWVPEDKYSGDKAKWKPAEQFLEYGKSINGILRKTNESLIKKNEDLAKKVDAIEKANSTALKFLAKKYEQEKQDLISHLKAVRKEAINNSDGERVAEIESQMEKVEADYQADLADLKTQQQEQAPQESPEFLEWKEKNSWYGSKKALTKIAETIGEELRSRNPELVGAPFLQRVEKEMKERFPDEFGLNSNRTKPTMVASGSAETSSSAKGTSYSDLPKDAKDACTELLKAGIPGLTKEQYAKEYFAMYGGK
ncbi:hypothetical protein UFOVP67_29 [uncultured Caudovirales phage]|uniref:Scaffolding protein n=1 Tax=uncultured Caudovirales phage TaxID=2100421 RepID=A0A6J5TCF8_9CAUD|nr:hypothetical protein UFOVP67_29 [uncultured Caudovirales phage]